MFGLVHLCALARFRLSCCGLTGLQRRWHPGRSTHTHVWYHDKWCFSGAGSMHAVQAYMQRGDARHEEDAAVKDRALVAALNQSARWNESQLVLGGCTFLAQAWASAVQVRLPWTCLHSDILYLRREQRPCGEYIIVDLSSWMADPTCSHWAGSHWAAPAAASVMFLGL